MPPCVVLPVDLLQFDGWNLGTRSNALAWVSASETDVHHYTLQSSDDGNAFHYLATIPAKGNTSSQSSYTMVDSTAFSPITYYRLSEMDMNGSYHDLSTIAVRSAQASDFILEVHPNPATDIVHFTYTGPTSDQSELRVSVFNNFGALVSEKSWSSLHHNSELSLETVHLAAGIYEMRLDLGVRTAYRKILVLGE